MGFEPMGEHVVPERSEEEQIMSQIEREGVAQATRMMANLNQLREQGLEAPEDVKKGLALLRAQIENYLGE